MNSKIKTILQRGISFFLGFVFTLTGISKLTNMPGIIGPNHLIEVLSKHDLGLYGHFIAYAQLTIGFLIITNRFRTLGAIMLIPVLANTLMVVISLHWSGTPYVVAFFLLLNIILLALDYHKIKFIFGNGIPNEIKSIHPKRSNMHRDLYYIIPFAIILAGCCLGRTDSGIMFTKIGVWTTLLSILAFNIGAFVKKKKTKKQKQN